MIKVLKKTQKTGSHLWNMGQFKALDRLQRSETLMLGCLREQRPNVWWSTFPCLTLHGWAFARWADGSVEELLPIGPTSTDPLIRYHYQHCIAPEQRASPTLAVCSHTLENFGVEEVEEGGAESLRQKKKKTVKTDATKSVRLPDMSSQSQEAAASISCAEMQGEKLQHQHRGSWNLHHKDSSGGNLQMRRSW